MTGAEYANLVAGYVARRFGPRSLKVYREIRVGKTIIGKNRCIDIFCVNDANERAFAIECKFQDSQGTVDEKIPYALAAYCLPQAGQVDTTSETRELDHLLAAHFGWWDVLVEKKKPV
jgi:hypothetical protein